MQSPTNRNDSSAVQEFPTSDLLESFRPIFQIVPFSAVPVYLNRSAPGPRSRFPGLRPDDVVVADGNSNELVSLQKGDSGAVKVTPEDRVLTWIYRGPSGHPREMTFEFRDLQKANEAQQELQRRGFS